MAATWTWSNACSLRQLAAILVCSRPPHLWCSCTPLVIMPCSGKSRVSSPGLRTAPPPPMTCCSRSSRHSTSRVLSCPFRSKISICVPPMRRSSYSLRAMGTLAWQRTLSSPLALSNDLGPATSLSCRCRDCTALSRHLCNLRGKSWISGPHLVEGVFVECVEVTVVHSADTGVARLTEEQSAFPEKRGLVAIL